MARRPNVFSQKSFQESLRQQGCPESFIAPVTSDFRLFVPLLIRHVGEEQLFKVVDEARQEFGLGDQEPAWRLACKHIVGWAEAEVAEYKSQKD